VHLITVSRYYHVCIATAQALEVILRFQDPAFLLLSQGARCSIFVSGPKGANIGLLSVHEIVYGSAPLLLCDSLTQPGRESNLSGSWEDVHLSTAYGEDMISATALEAVARYDGP